MAIEIGTTYSISSIAAHTGLSESYLRNSDSSLRKIIAAFPQLSPDGKGLNDEGLILYNEYLEFCSNKNPKGKRRRPKMTFDQFKEYAMSELGISSNDAIDNDISTELMTVEQGEIIDVEVMPIGSIFDEIDDDLEAVGNMLAAKVGQSIKSKITNKIAREVNAQFAEINQLVEKFTK
ncbi:MAG: hypothetical protein WBA13_14305 [Microcoleaceae cyanobacterium]